MTAATQPAKLLGIPLGDFGFFSSLLLSLASGFLAFFASCFCTIIALLFWNLAGHHHVNYADSYLYVAFPTGAAVLALSLVFLTGTWLRRKMSH
ncbi:MAG TPA: hypothetical protein VHZ25_08650 [Acidobacteriaceae bacterium]|jgi:hypothetical protein|nr:hypothetical protein [Acidobacteriaceae bacterium]